VAWAKASAQALCSRRSCRRGVAHSRVCESAAQPRRAAPCRIASAASRPSQRNAALHDLPLRWCYQSFCPS